MYGILGYSGDNFLLVIHEEVLAIKTTKTTFTNNGQHLTNKRVFSVRA
jgi:hypothetical protein